MFYRCFDSQRLLLKQNVLCVYLSFAFSYMSMLWPFFYYSVDIFHMTFMGGK